MAEFKLKLVAHFDKLRHFTKAFADSRHGFYKLFAAKCAYPKGVKSVFGCMIQYVGYHFFPPDDNRSQDNNTIMLRYCQYYYKNIVKL